MTRVKRSVHARKKRRKVLAQASGYWGLKSKVYRRAKEQVQHSLQYAYRDRRVRKRDFRRLWIVRINAAARMHGLSYSQLMHGLKRAEVGRRPQGAGRPRRARAEDVRSARRARQGSAARSDPPPRMRLHDHPRSSNAQKVRFLLGVLDLEYERRTVPFEPPRPGWHLALNPIGGIPVLIDGDVVLAESNAILRYLAAREGRADLLPASARERAPVDWVLDAVATDAATRGPRGRRAGLRLPAAARDRRRGSAARRRAGRDRGHRAEARGVRRACSATTATRATDA